MKMPRQRGQHFCQEAAAGFNTKASYRKCPNTHQLTDQQLQDRSGDVFWNVLEGRCHTGSGSGPGSLCPCGHRDQAASQAPPLKGRARWWERRPCPNVKSPKSGCQRAHSTWDTARDGTSLQQHGAEATQKTGAGLSAGT